MHWESNGVNRAYSQNLSLLVEGTCPFRSTIAAGSLYNHRSTSILRLIILWRCLPLSLVTRQRRVHAGYDPKSGACITHLKMGLDVFHLRNICHAGRMITRQKDWDWHEVPEK